MFNEKEAVRRRFLIFCDVCVLVVAYFFALFANNLLSPPAMPILKYLAALAFAIPYWLLRSTRTACTNP